MSAFSSEAPYIFSVTGKENYCTAFIKGRYLTFLIGCFCFRGKQNLNLTVTDGAPLPFAYDILTTALHYGNRVFVEYPHDIPDYFKQSFSKDSKEYSWERSLTFEDGGICIARSDIK